MADDEETPPNVIHRRQIGLKFIRRHFKVKTGSEESRRGQWAGRADFILSCIGYAVGLGNVWRFPYLCYRNGGGVFFIPYFMSLLCIGMPLLALEFAVGQFSSAGPYRAWEFVSAFRGIGITMILISVTVSFYYNTIIAWAIWYLFASMTNVLPWSKCGSWSSEFCETKLHAVNSSTCTLENGLLPHANNGTCYNRTSGLLYGIYNVSLAAEHNIKAHLPAEDYLQYVGLQIAKSSGLADLGAPRWDMSLCILLSWIIIFAILISGVQSSGRVAYFTATFPYVILLILLACGLTQEGSGEGIYFFLTPDLSVLSKGEVWKDAGSQIFFSLSCAMGGMVVYASYNPFNRDLIRNAIVISFCNSLTSILAGFVIFSYLGSFAHATGLEVKDVVQDGVQLAFVVYAQACTVLPGGPFWAVAFFLMLIILGVDSLFSMVETVVIGITELFPKFTHFRRLILLFVLIVFFLFGLSMATPGGAHVLTLFDSYAMTWNVFILALVEMVGVAIYGPLRLTKDIEIMIGEKTLKCVPWRILKWFFIVCWCSVTPILLTFILGYSLSQLDFKTHKDWYYVCGWSISLIIIAPTFFIMIYSVVRAKGSFMERMRTVLKPTDQWGPYSLEHRKLVTYVDGFILNPRGVTAAEEKET